MPAAPTRRVSAVARAFGYLALAAFCGAVAYAAWCYPIPTFVILALLSVGVLYEQRRMKRIALSRPHVGICEFARSFNCAETDTWVIRAVYEELGAYLSSNNAPFPLLASDNLFSNYSLNIESLDLQEVAEAAAARAGRSMKDTAANPYFDKVNTVSDLVHFLNAQPRVCHA